MVKIRLQRFGKKKMPFYKVVVVDSKKKRDGIVIEALGNYSPVAPTNQFSVNEEKVIGWLKNGAQPTDTLKSLLKKSGLWIKYKGSKSNATA